MYQLVRMFLNTCRILDSKRVIPRTCEGAFHLERLSTAKSNSAIGLIALCILWMGNAHAEGPYVDEWAGDCYDVESCYALTEIYWTTVQTPDYYENCYDQGSFGPILSQYNLWRIDGIVACTAIDDGDLHGRLFSFFASGWPPECDQGPGNPPVCPPEEGYALVPPSPPCTAETSDRTNPCDTATGLKTQTEMDYASQGIGGLTFAVTTDHKGPSGPVKGWV